MTDTVDVEMVVIGGLLCSDECRRATDVLSPNDFSHPGLRAIFSAIQSVCKSGGNPKDALPKLSESEMKLAISSTACFVSSASFDGYIATLQDASQQRSLINAISDLIYTQPDTETIVSTLQSIVNAHESSQKASESSETTFWVNYLDEVNAPYDPSRSVKTGFGAIDRATGGILKGSLCYIGAPPSTGKTMFAGNIVENAVRNNRKCVFFTLEMSANQIVDRLMSSMLGIPYKDIQNHQTTRDQKAEIATRADELNRSRLLYVREKANTIETIARETYALRPELIVVDYIQLVRTAQGFRTSREEINYVSAELKHLARSADCATIVLSQVARTIDTRTQKPRPPRMSDLKESGNLEADGDYIMMLYRPFVYDKAKYDPVQTRLLLDKNKYGETGPVELKFDGVYQKFYEVDDRYGA